MPSQLGFIGAGNMAEAIAKAAVSGAVLGPNDMVAADPSEDRRQAFADLGIRVVSTNAEVVRACDQVLLAVKPQVIATAAAEFREHLGDGQIIISIMAGITTAKLCALLDRPARIVRVMPNTPMMVGCGMAGIALGDHARAGDDDLAMNLFSAGDSLAIRVPESALDALTAVSGSGPAYLFYLAEAMQRGARELGLEPHADELVAQTLRGAARLLCESEDGPAELRGKVTSPGGTTESAIKHMDGNKTIDVIVNAMKAAEARSRELGS